MWLEYGILYNWYAVTDPRGIAPEEWQVPSVNDWKTLCNTLVAGVTPGADDKKNADEIVGQYAGMQNLDLDQYLTREEADSLAWEIKLATTAGIQLKNTDSWNYQGKPTNGNNRSGFGGMGYGYRYMYNFMFPGEETAWWTSTSYISPQKTGSETIADDITDEELAYHATLSYDHIFFPDQVNFKECGYYVRCIRKQ